MLQFIGGEIDPEEAQFNKFALDKLPADSTWRNKTFDDLSDSEKQQFYGYQFAVRYLKTQSDDEVRDMFRRLNKYLSPLKAQELRNATYCGPFVELVNRLADEDYWVESKIVSPVMIRRMGDVEFVSELLIGALHGPQGGSAKVIDEYYERYEDYEDEFPDQRAATRLFKFALDQVQSVLPNIKKTRWANKSDFYSLFVAFCAALRTKKLRRGGLTALRRELLEFAESVDERRTNKTARVKKTVIDYVGAIEKHVNDKSRRALRHGVVLRLLDPYFLAIPLPKS